jgi:hypothetical protein
MRHDAMCCDGDGRIAGIQRTRSGWRRSLPYQFRADKSRPTGHRQGQQSNVAQWRSAGRASKASQSTRTVYLLSPVLCRGPLWTETRMQCVPKDPDCTSQCYIRNINHSEIHPRSVRDTTPRLPSATLTPYRIRDFASIAHLVWRAPPTPTRCLKHQHIPCSKVHGPLTSDVDTPFLGVLDPQIPAHRALLASSQAVWRPGSSLGENRD